MKSQQYAVSKLCAIIHHTDPVHSGGWHSGATGDDGFLSHVDSGDGESHTGWGEI